MPSQTRADGNPKTLGPHPPFEEKKQAPPGSEQAMREKPDHGEQSYRGFNRLAGKVALITGADSGIGKAVAIAYAREGADVVLSYLHPDEAADAQETVHWVEDAGRRALSIEGDIRDERHCRTMVERAAGELGRLDILVNNAGLMLLGPAHGADLDDWRRMVDVNLLGLMYCTHAAIPHLTKAAAEQPRQVADIVNIGALAGRAAFGMSAVYCATKFGVGAFSEALRQELAGRHVRVSVVEPGSVDTDLRGHNPAVIQQQLAARLGEIDRLESHDVADAVGYIVTRPRHVAVAELLIRPTEQARA